MFIKNALIYTMTGEIIENGSILISEGKIVDLGQNLNVSSNCEEIDAGGRMVTPGFIDAHCHIGLGETGIGFEGADYNERIDPLTPHLRAIDAINPMDVALRSAYEAG